MTKVIAFNGPPSCGKDTAANFCVASFAARAAKMADPLKDAICAFFNLTREELEILKPQVCPYSVSGLTWREVMIDISENWAKRLFGQEICGEVALLRIKDEPALVVVSDSGFAVEAQPWIDKYGADNVLLVRIHRPGFDFKGDSRGYISLSDEGVKEVDIQNDGTLSEFQRALWFTVSDFAFPNSQKEAA